MSNREIVTSRRPYSRHAAALAAALLLAGCSGNKAPTPPTSTPPESPAQTATAAPATTPPDAPAPNSGQLDGGTCLQLTGAVVNLMSGSSPDDAQKAADTINGFHPPADVQTAVAHFVGTNGLHTSDPARSQYSRALNDWVEKQCPVQKSPDQPK